MTNRSLLQPIAAGLAALLLPALSPAQSNVPSLMTYQGFVTDSSSVPLGNATPTNFPIEFRIYSSAQGGSPLWGEAQTVTIFQGNFSVILGNGSLIGGTPKPDLASVFISQDRYLGITVDDGGTPTEFAPRQRILTNAYSFRASIAESAESVVGTLTTGSNMVGINNTSPGTALDVVGVIRTDRTSIGTPAIGPTGGNGERFIFEPGPGGDTNYAMGINGTSLWSGVPSGKDFSWYTGQTQRMVLTSSGNLGLGTPSPAARLHVNGSAWVGSDTGGLGPSAGNGVRTFFNNTEDEGKFFAYDYATGTPKNLALQGPGGEPRHRSG